MVRTTRTSTSRAALPLRHQLRNLARQNKGAGGGGGGVAFRVDRWNKHGNIGDFETRRKGKVQVVHVLRVRPPVCI